MLMVSMFVIECESMKINQCFLSNAKCIELDLIGKIALSTQTHIYC